MKRLAKRWGNSALRRFGYEVLPLKEVAAREEFPADFDLATQELCRSVGPYTLTSPERLFALRQSVQYVVRRGIPGDIVECGVWKGGSMMAVARTLLESSPPVRTLHMFDTFEGMSKPTDVDIDFEGRPASAMFEQSGEPWVCSPLSEVQRNLQETGYPAELMRFVKGRVEETIPEYAPPSIALLRLDTDWYESTYHELVHLYPRLSVGGVLIIDDYGHWAGARKAVDDYFAQHRLAVLLHRIDYTGRICVKTCADQGGGND